MEIREISEELQQFENLVKMINFEYNQYFTGNIKHPPIVHERAVSKIIRKYNIHQITNSTLRFKFNNLVAKYLTFKERWRRKMLEFEGVKKGYLKKEVENNNENYEFEDFNIENSNKLPYENELDKLPANYNREKIISLIESKIIELEKKGYNNIDVKIDMSNGKPKLKIRHKK